MTALILFTGGAGYVGLQAGATEVFDRARPDTFACAL